MRALLTRTEEEFANRHGRLAGGETAVVAFGRLGSREMTAGSDLDLIVVYEHDAEPRLRRQEAACAVAILCAADAAADRGARRADRRGDRLRGRSQAPAVRAGGAARHELPRSSTIS